MLNLNENSLFLHQFISGETHNIECRLGRKLYYIDVKKDSSSAYVELYRKVKPSRNDFSKYDKAAAHHGVHVKPGAILDRDFFENIAAIENAQRIVYQYGRQLV